MVCVSIKCTYSLQCDSTAHYKYGWLAIFITFLSDDCAHHMKLQVSDF